MEHKTSFIVHSEWIDAMAELDDDTRLRLYEAMFSYAMTGIMPELSPLEKTVFALIKAQMDRSNERYEDTKQKRSEAGRKGSEKRWHREEALAEIATGDMAKPIANDSKNSKDSKCHFAINCEDSKNSKDSYNVDVNVDVDVIKENDVVVKEKTADADIIDKEIAVLKTQDIWLDTLQTLHHIDKNCLIRYLDQYALHCRAYGKDRHDNHGDLKGHFNNWLRIRLQEDARQQQNSRRGRNNLTDAIKNYDSTF